MGHRLPCSKILGCVLALRNNAGTTKFVHHGDLEGLASADFRRIYDPLLRASKSGAWAFKVWD